jgi:UDPglucose 6-dehydrogenase
MTPRRITVIGCGHVGLVTACGFAHLGHTVVGLDISTTLVEQLNAGINPFVEDGLDELLSAGHASGRLVFTTDYGDALNAAEFVFLTVDTPASPAGGQDLSNIRSAVTSIRDGVRGDVPVVVNKSTSPVGTAEEIAALLSRRDDSHKPRVVSNPEFLREGQAVYDFLQPDRIVIGADSEADANEVADLYGDLGPLLMTDVRTAELIKYVANSFLATRISFANEVANLSDALGVDVDEVLRGAGMDRRIGTRYFAPGLGYGGSCLPKDVASLRHIAHTNSVAMPVLDAVDEANRARPAEVVRRLRAELGELRGKQLGVWGVTFKGGTEDTRSSPAVAVISALLNEGASVRAFDPAASAQVPADVAPTLVDDALEAARDADALVVLTDWPDFKDVPLDLVTQAMCGRLVLDGRNVLDPGAVSAEGLTYVGMGRRRRQPAPSA